MTQDNTQRSDKDGPVNTSQCKVSPVYHPPGQHTRSAWARDGKVMLTTYDLNNLDHGPRDDESGLCRPKTDNDQSAGRPPALKNSCNLRFSTCPFTGEVMYGGITTGHLSDLDLSDEDIKAIKAIDQYRWEHSVPFWRPGDRSPGLEAIRDSSPSSETVAPLQYTRVHSRYDFRSMPARERKSACTERTKSAKVEKEKAKQAKKSTEAKKAKKTKKSSKTAN
ncbi:hypothetical protein ANO11243_056000 [Dothideomycetidae sp. 11243]|nr:hypothetical protein ANO11243_056000 [fungal sp. No.11243]